MTRTTEPPTSEELTRAWILALRGDSNLTQKDKDFIQDVLVRDTRTKIERSMWFYELQAKD